AFAIPALARGRMVDLYLEALDRESGLLVRRVEIDPRVARGLRQRLHLEFEVLEVPPRVEEVRPFAVGDDLPVANLPGVFVLARTPSVQVFPVEQRAPSFVSRSQRQRCETTH